MMRKLGTWESCNYLRCREVGHHSVLRMDIHHMLLVAIRLHVLHLRHLMRRRGEGGEGGKGGERGEGGEGRG